MLAPWLWYRLVGVVPRRSDEADQAGEAGGLHGSSSKPR